MNKGTLNAPSLRPECEPLYFNSLCKPASKPGARKRLRRAGIATLAGILLLTSLGANAQTVRYGETTQVFPHFAVGAGWTTTITVHNPTIEMFKSDGSALLSREISLAPSQTENVRIDVAAAWCRWCSSSTTCRIASTATDCTMAATTSVTNLTDLLTWDIVGNQTGAQPANPGVVSVAGVCK
jgi:hypothetical protein